MIYKVTVYFFKLYYDIYHIIFFYENLYKMEFDFDEVVEEWQEYDSIDLRKIKKPVIAVHK